jgi:MGT family glycosyltransferase
LTKTVARFLFTLWPFPGHVHPNLAIAHALRARGHDAAFYTGDSIRSSLVSEGFDCFPFMSVDESGVTKTVSTLDSLSLDWRSPRRRKALLVEWLLGTVDAQLADLRTILDVWRPDVLVCDPAMWGPLLVLQESEQIPLAIMSYVAACMLPGPDGPIVGLPLPRARSVFGRMGRFVLRGVADLVSADVRRAAGRVRQRYGLSPLHTSVTAFAGQMPLYLVPSTPAYDRQRHDLPATVQYVGPCQRDKPSTDATPSWLRNLSRANPVVYVTEGTMHAKEPILLRAALKGLASVPVDVVATTGRHRAVCDLGLDPVPSNARVEQWIPHSDVLPRADVVVTTGGTGTVLATVSSGTPLVIVPMAWDQPENAWRVVEAGAGLRLPPRECKPDRIRGAVRRVLDEPSFRKNAQRLAKDFARYGGAAQAATLLEDLAILSARPPAARKTLSYSGSLRLPPGIGSRAVHFQRAGS